MMSKLVVDLDKARCDLAAIFRWTARENMHEGIANHFSYAVSDDGQQFLMNPYGVHFSNQFINKDYSQLMKAIDGKKNFRP